MCSREGWDGGGAVGCSPLASSMEPLEGDETKLVTRDTRVCHSSFLMAVKTDRASIIQ